MASEKGKAWGEEMETWEGHLTLISLGKKREVIALSIVIEEANSHPHPYGIME